MLVSLPFVRCLLLRHADGRAVSARVETRGGAQVLVLVDEVCTGGDNGKVPDCDKRTIEVSLPDGAKLDTSISNDFVTPDIPRCPSRFPVGNEWIEVDERAHAIVVSRSAQPGAAEGTWSTKVPGECQLATIVDDVLVLATSTADHRAVGIDLATGTQRWRVRP